MWSTHDTDDDTKKETDEEFRSPETDFLVKSSSVKVILVNPWEQYVKNLVEHHDNRVHHIVHVRRRHWVFFCRGAKKICKRRMHEIGVDDLQNPNKDNKQRCNEQICAAEDAEQSDKGQVPNIKNINIKRICFVEHKHDDVYDNHYQQKIQRVRRTPRNRCQRGPSNVGNRQVDTC